MADSNSQQPRCPCGFWGTAQTMGLCSKCYQEKGKGEQRVDEASSTTAGLMTATAISKAVSQVKTVITSASASAISNATTLSPSPISMITAATSLSSDVSEEKTTITQVTTATTAKSCAQEFLAAQSSTNASASSSTSDLTECLDPDRPVQTNKKRCFKCNCKMELAFREIGRCKCEYIFCPLHRLPEQHECIYDHKGKGRQEAREKMISPKKHMGNALKRIDSDH